MKRKFTKLITVSIAFLVFLTSCVNDKDKEAEAKQTSTTVQTETSEMSSKEITVTKTEATQTTPKQTIATQTEPSKQETVTQFATTSQISTTKITEETTKKVTTTTENEEDTSCEMPEVVFILAHYNWDYTNAYGYYINNDGIILSFDFRKTAPEELYNIGDLDVYNKIEEISVDTDFEPVTKVTLEDLYQKLQNVSEDNKLEVKQSDIEIGAYDPMGQYYLYGARFNNNQELNIVELGIYGELNCYCTDSIANELFEELKLLIPDPHEYLY